MHGLHHACTLSPWTAHLQARDVLCAAWAARRRPGKAEAGFFRAAAYLNAGCPEQALKDARYALVYGPQLEGSGVTALVPSGSGGEGSSEAGGSQGGVGEGESGAGAAALPPAVQQPLSAWPAGLALLAAAHEALAENVPAALAMQASGRGAGQPSCCLRLLLMPATGACTT